jgi:hypothetical protein
MFFRSFGTSGFCHGWRINEKIVEFYLFTQIINMQVELGSICRTKALMIFFVEIIGE